MARNIKVKWDTPCRLVKRSEKRKLEYIMKFRWDHENILESITNGPGVYFFARRHGKTDENILFPLYIGHAKNVRRRIMQHFDSVKLMTKIRDAATGGKVLVVGTIERDAERASGVVEKALIKKAMSDGYDLFQCAGNKNQG